MNFSIEKSPNRERKEIEKIVRALKPVAEILARMGVNLKIIEGNSEETLHFDSKTQACVINIAFLKEKGLTDYYEILFCVAHEVGHFIQLISDPEGFKYLFELIKRKAEEMTRYVLNNPSLRDKIIRDLTETLSPEERQMSDEKILQNIFIEVYHQLVNSLMDIMVNSLIRKRLVPFQEGQSHEDTLRDIYRNKLFPTEEESKGEKKGEGEIKAKGPDYSTLPHYVQFTYSLLRNFMVSDEEAVVSPIVSEALTREIQYLGEEKRLFELSDELSSSELKMFFLSALLESYYFPIFEELLIKDIEEGRFRVVKPPIDLHGKFSDIGKVIEEYGKSLEEKSKSAKQISEELSKKRYEEASRKAGFTEKEINELYEILRSVEAIMEEMKKIWYNFLTEIIDIEQEKIGHFKYGTTINIYKVIREWPTIRTSPQEAEIFERYIPTEKKELVPKKIKICLVIDLSESMTPEKRKAVQEITYAIIQSLINFREEMKRNYPQFPIPGVEWKIIGFGGEGSVRDLPLDITGDEETNLKRAVLDIMRINLGGTYDAQALEMTRSFFTEEDIKEIRSGNTLGIVLEITDGETKSKDQSKELVAEINNSGIFCRGIKIPELGIGREREGEKRTEEESEGSDIFQKVWGKNGEKIEYLEQLPSVVSDLLEEAITTTKE